MIIKKDCVTCSGSGKYKDRVCPDCLYRHLFRIASQLVEDHWYPIPADRMEEMQEIYQSFSEPCIFHTWHIELNTENKIRRVDYSWMK